MCVYLNYVYVLLDKLRILDVKCFIEHASYSQASGELVQAMGTACM